MSTPADPVSCLACGRAPDDEQDLLGWGVQVDQGRVRRLCPACARAHVRDIEGKLDEAFWA